MNIQVDNWQLSLGFLDRPEISSNMTAVSLNDLTRVLDAFQRSVYATAAYELQLPSVKNLKDEQRQLYSLVVVSYRQGSFWTDLLPLIVTTLSQHPGLFPHEEMIKHSFESIKRAWETASRTIDALRHVFAGQEHDAVLDRVIGRHAVEIAQTAVRSGQTVEIVSREPSGAEHILRTSYEANHRVLARPSERREKVQPFDEMIVKDILTSQPVIKVVKKGHPDHLIKCEYPKGQETDYGRLIGIADVVTIVGAPVWTDYDNLSPLPDVIEVMYTVHPDGIVIGQPPFDQFVY